jgi:hypothetical protein
MRYKKIFLKKNAAKERNPCGGIFVHFNIHRESVLLRQLIIQDTPQPMA